MTIDERFDRQLPDILERLYLGPSPDYRDEVLAAAVQTRQRRSRTFPGRWFPMVELVDIAVRPVPVTRLPLRALGTTMVIAAVLLGALAVVGSRPRTPQPFGPARNGIITWALDGDVYVGDPGSGTSRRVVASSDIDRNPVFSRDGTHLAFMRQVPSQTGKFDVVVTHDDGAAPTVVSAVPVGTPRAIEWAPDGRSLLVNDAGGRLTRYFVDGSPSQVVVEGVRLQPDAFQPPDGASLLYERDDDLGALYVMHADGSGARQLFGPVTAPCACTLGGPARWSPDGTQVAIPVSLAGGDARLYVIDADGGGFRKLTNEDGGWYESDPAWSPDGTQIAFNRWEHDGDGLPARAIGIVPAAGGQVTPLGVAPPDDGALIEWAPDGRSILSLPGTLREGYTWSPDATGTVARPTLIDVAAGTSRQLDWSVGSIGSWQRLAP